MRRKEKLKPTPPNVVKKIEQDYKRRLEQKERNPWKHYKKVTSEDIKNNRKRIKDIDSQLRVRYKRKGITIEEILFWIMVAIIFLFYIFIIN